ncbi:MAG: hypothetical protein EOO10_10435 [Chitinophagaceae bacterium]|nr:MAG: hypothetical protein EOO10_10435 [Chitinophagaceae bacterium]
MLRLIFFFFVVLSLSACSNSSKRRNTPYIASNPSMPFQFKPALPTTNEGKLPTVLKPLPNQLSVPNSNPYPVTVITNPTTTTVNAATTSVGVNPAHGQPGHSCDVSVGAPLSNPAVSTVNTKSQTSQPIPTPPTASTITKAATTGVNPGHGQPGHRCDISVGAPLNGATLGASSTPNATAIVPATNQIATSSATPVLPAVSRVNPADSKNVKLNPAHGQPGHDCAIVVGQPLKK